MIQTFVYPFAITLLIPPFLNYFCSCLSWRGYAFRLPFSKIISESFIRSVSFNSCYCFCPSLSGCIRNFQRTGSLKQETSQVKKRQKGGGRGGGGREERRKKRHKQSKVPRRKHSDKELGGPAVKVTVATIWKPEGR